MPTDREMALAFLRTNPLQHLVHMKYLHLYPADIDCFYTEANGATGILLSYKPQLTSWDQSAYAIASNIFLPVVTNREMADRLIEQITPQVDSNPFVCKFCDGGTKDIFAEAFRLEPARTLISYTTDRFEIDDNDVVISNSLDEQTAKLFRENGYSQDELSTRFANGAFSFTIYQDKQPASTCYIFQNFDNVWEIAGVRTVDWAQRKGYARRVVGAALQMILNKGWIPRYQAEATNAASIHLAEALGLRICLRFEHYWAM